MKNNILKFKGTHPGTKTEMDVAVINFMHDEVYFFQGTDVSYEIAECKLTQATGEFDADGKEIYVHCVTRV